MIAIIVLLLIGIGIRWNAIEKRIVRGFDWFSGEEQTESTE